MSEQIKGRISQIIGAVVDVHFDDNVTLPNIYDALEVHKENGEKLILEWVNHCDLFRIKGVGSEYADLLEEAGVDTVAELANRKPDNLFKKIEEVNAEKKLVRRVPALSQVTDWVRQAKEMPRGVEY